MTGPYMDAYHADEMLKRIRTAEGFLRSAMELAVGLEAEGYVEAINLQRELEEVLTKLASIKNVSYLRLRREVAQRVRW